MKELQKLEAELEFQIMKIKSAKLLGAFVLYRDYIDSILSICPNPDCKSTNIKHEKEFSYCNDCKRIFNGKFQK